MSEHQSMTREEYLALVRDTIPPKYIRDVINFHIKFSGEHPPTQNKEEEFALKRAHLAAIKRKEILPEDLSTGDVKVRHSQW